MDIETVIGVTILVLVEYSLQYQPAGLNTTSMICHNPCFSRILFAIMKPLKEKKNLTGHNPCFSRILFAIEENGIYYSMTISHNPCFSRILFAIQATVKNKVQEDKVTILVLVEYSLQSLKPYKLVVVIDCHNPCFSRILFAIKFFHSEISECCSHNPCFSRILFAMHLVPKIYSLTI